MFAKPPAPPHVLMANGGEDPDEDQDQDQGGGNAMPGSAAPVAPGAPPSGPGGQPGAPGPGAGQVNAIIAAMVKQIQSALTPQEIQETSGLLTPRLTQLLTKADPALQIVVEAFSQAADQDTPDEGDAMDGSGGESASDADALSTGGSQGQYAPAYGSPNAAPGGFPRKPVGGLGNIGG